MPQSPELVVLLTHGADHELSSVAFTIANGGMTAGLRVSAFLTSAAVDLVRKRAIDSTVVPPLDPLASLVKDFLARGGRLWACTPCVRARGYEQSRPHRGRGDRRVQQNTRADQGRSRDAQLLTFDGTR